MTNYPTLSAVEREILTLLRSREMYGLEMVRASSKLKRGTIYVTLDRMGNKGFVSSHAVSDPNASGMPKRIYKITALGHRVMVSQQAAEAAFDEFGGAYA